ncbi:MAG TPA: hypothetical protein VNN79_11060, partial [Actinomycetota bacterium]|nr:hypothetical protein [Actinomycetota bacterium]
PETDSFKQWDSLADVPRNGAGNGPVAPETISLGGQRRKEIPLFVNVPALTRDYSVFDFAPDVGRIEFRNGLDGVAGASVQALVKLEDGTWKDPQDWTDRDSITFCRAKPAENVVRLVVITGDSTSDDLGHALTTSDTKLVATSDCLPETYSGTFSGTAEVGGGMKMFWSGTATFVRVTGSEAQSCVGFVCWKVSTGSVTWHVGTTPGTPCSYSSDPKVTPVTIGNIDVEPTKGQDGVQTYFGGITASDTTDGTIDCGGGPQAIQLSLLDCCATMGSQQPLPVQQDGWLLADSLSTGGAGNEIDETWSFQGH